MPLDAKLIAQVIASARADELALTQYHIEQRVKAAREREVKRKAYVEQLEKDRLERADRVLETLKVRVDQLDIATRKMVERCLS